MKTMLLSIFILAFSIVYSQDTLRIKQIDALVSAINTSTLSSHRDTLTHNYPEMGLKMTTYLTAVVNDSELVKYVNFVYSTTTENAEIRKMTASNTFYYDHNKLIKVEEYLIEDDKKKTADWYYSEDKPLYYTLQSDKAVDRAALLLTMSKEMVKKFFK